MRRFVEATDRVPEGILLAINGCAGLTVTVLHGLFLKFGDFPASFVRSIWPLEVVLIVAAGVAAFDSAAGLLWKRVTRTALAIEACLAIIVSVALVTWAITIVIVGTPRDVGFAWSPGFLGAIAGYSVYLLRRTLLHRWIGRPSVFYAHLWTFFIVLPIEVAVVARLIFDFMTRH
jgi:hypothetical protein